MKQEIYSAMRSMFRLCELKEMNSPASLILMEENLLKKYLKCLSIDDMIFFAKNFNDFQAKAKVDDAVATENFFKEAEKHFGNLN